jgi:hypothetical protein
LLLLIPETTPRALEQFTVGMVEAVRLQFGQKSSEALLKLFHVHAELRKEIFVVQGSMRGPQQHVTQDVSLELIHGSASFGDSVV